MIFGLVVFALRAAVGVTVFYIFLTRHFSQFIVLCGVREKRVNALRPTKTYGFSFFVDVTCLAGRVPGKQKEGENHSQNPDQKTFQNH